MTTVCSVGPARKSPAVSSLPVGRWLLTCGTLVLLSLLPGCMTVGPDFQRPEAPLADQWLEADSPQLNATSELDPEWWKVFADPALDNLIHMAQAQNLPLQVAGLRVLEARAVLGIATGNLYPQLQQINAGANVVQASDNAANTISGDLNYQSLGTSFDAAWELDFLGKFRRGVEAADAGFLAAIADYDDVLVALNGEVARTYILLRTMQERIRLAEDSVDIQRRSLEIAENRFDGGLVTELDVQQARNLLASTQALIPRLQVEYSRALHAMNVLLGLPPQSMNDLLAGAVNIPLPPAEVVVGVPADLLRRRPDIRRAELQTAAQSALVGVSKADLYPHFSLAGSIGFQSSDSDFTRAGGSSLGDLFKSQSLTYFAGPSLSWDLFNYGRIKNRVRVEDARLQQLITNYRNTVLRAALEVEDAMVGFLRNQEESALLAKAAAASRRSVDLALLQYREGLTDYQRVLDTQRQLTQDQDQLTAVQGSVALNLVGLYKAMGGGWEVRAGKELVPTAVQQEMADRTSWGGMLPVKPSAEGAEVAKPQWHSPDW